VHATQYYLLLPSLLAGVQRLQGEGAPRGCAILQVLHDAANSGIEVVQQAFLRYPPSPCLACMLFLARYTVLAHVVNASLPPQRPYANTPAARGGRCRSVLETCHVVLVKQTMAWMRTGLLVGSPREFFIQRDRVGGSDCPRAGLVVLVVLLLIIRARCRHLWCRISKAC